MIFNFFAQLRHVTRTGGGEQLSDYVKENLITELMKRPTAHVFLARLDDKPAGKEQISHGPHILSPHSRSRDHIRGFLHVCMQTIVEHS